MKIVVCVKQVPDTSEVRIDPVTNNLVREGVPGILNPYDANGLEEALRLRDRHGGTVTAVSMGPPQASETLEQCLRMGADEAVLLSDRAVGGSDTLATGYALSRLIETLEYDLVICGGEAVDGCTGQVGPMIAGNLGLTQFTCVRELAAEGKTLFVKRDVGRNIERYEAGLPAVVCVLKDINQPRNPGKASGEVKIVTAADLKLDPARIGNDGSPTKVVKIELSDARAKSYVVIDDTLPWDERIRMIIDGGIARKEKLDLWRGTADGLADRLLELEAFARFLETA